MSKNKKYFVDYFSNGWPICDEVGPLGRNEVAELLNSQKQQIDKLNEALKHLYHNAKASGAEYGLALDVAKEALEANR